MSSTSITRVLNELFTAPINAVTLAEREYRKTWANWLEFQFKLLKESGTAITPELLAKILDIAPVVGLDGVIEAGITMRIAEVNSKEGGFSAGLQLGPIHASGRFGFSNQSSQESIFQASTRYTISNQETNLKEYLSNRDIEPANEEQLVKAIAFLKKDVGETEAE